METKEKYISRCLELASYGAGSVSPNPLVGCVIVHREKIIGEGFHREYGGAHAEVNAIADVKDKEILSSSTLYVSLEPCSHYGKTPPCADLIIKHRIPEVVVCNLDPNPLVAGKGIDKLKKAGVQVTTGILENHGHWINRRFFTNIEKRRPYVILKWAQSANGIMGYPGKRIVISDELNTKRVHQWRSVEDAIWVGKNTVISDNPSLTTRKVLGKNPIRITMDKQDELDQGLEIFNDEARTLIFSHTKSAKSGTCEWIQVKDTASISDLLEELFRRQIQSVMVEGGARLLAQFIEEGIWDEARVSSLNKNISKGIKAPNISEEKLYKRVEEENMIVSVYTNFDNQA